ncbi:MAG: hypothetical protein KAV87_04570 [Desulfobacteraceae bacterium]|nr:hypothetical protein [Desulfobacteraceae bacterium]
MNGSVGLVLTGVKGGLRVNLTGYSADLGLSTRTRLLLTGLESAGQEFVVASNLLIAFDQKISPLA